MFLTYRSLDGREKDSKPLLVEDWFLLAGQEIVLLDPCLIMGLMTCMCDHHLTRVCSQTEELP